jgi:hypothetical protein
MESFVRSQQRLERHEDLNFQVLSWEAMDEHENLDDDDSLKVYNI